MTLSFTEENYLTAILNLSHPPDWKVSTNSIASELETTAASVTDMLKRLSDKELITYQRYKGVSLTAEGQRRATTLLRKHRLWKVFLVQSLGMPWEDVHLIAGELEHIQSEDLIERLDKFLGHPKFDPHGEPIPNAQGKYTLRAQIPLSELKPGQEGVIIGVREHESSFLKHLNEKGISLGKHVRIITNDQYDNTLHLTIEEQDLNLSGTVARNVMIKTT